MRRAPQLPLLGLLLGVVPAVAGCHLVDQRSFDRTADRPPRPPMPRPVRVAAGPGALVSFPADAPASDWTDVLRTAADLARSRKASVVFRVEAAVPPGHGDPQAQAASLGAALGAAREAADVIVADGVARDQVELAAVTDAAIRRPEIRIFVR